MGDPELDVTRAALQAARDRYFELFQRAPVGYVALAADGMVIETNQTACDLLGVSRADLLHRRLVGFAADAEAAAELERCRRAAVAGSTAHSCEVDLRCEDGTPLRCLVRSIADPGVGATLTTLNNVTALRRQDKARLREQRARLRAILDTTPDGIITVDGHGTIETFNRAAERIFGYQASEIIGRNVRVLLPERYGGDDQLFGRYLVAGERTEISGLTRAGVEFPLEVSVGAFPGTRERYTGLVRDVSERKRLQRELARSHRLEAIGRLASGVAHDFNNLLMGIAGCVEIALAEVDGRSKARYYLQEIGDAAARGSAITRQLMAFARGEGSGGGRAELDSAIRHQQTIVRSLIGEDIQIVLELAAPGAEVPLSEGQIEQLLLNLAANARDAMPTGGRLAIRTELIESADGDADSGESSGTVLLSVADSGCGMDEQTQELAFEPFFTTKEPGEGSGLGLSIIFGFVHHAGGRVEIHSEPEKGTVVELRLPCTVSPGRSEPAPVCDVDRMVGTVLVAEDEPMVRMAVRYYLESAGFRVLDARSGPDAVACCERYSGRIDLLLTDIVLPTLGGRELAAEVRRMRPGVRVVYMSAHPRALLVEAGRIDPEAEPLQKPFTQAQLMARVSSELAGPAGPA